MTSILSSRQSERRHARRKTAFDSPPAPAILSAQAGVMKWQTCQTQNLVGGNARVGSSPTAGKETTCRTRRWGPTSVSVGSLPPPRQAFGIPKRVPKRVIPATSAVSAHKARLLPSNQEQSWYTCLGRRTRHGSVCLGHILHQSTRTNFARDFRRLVDRLFQAHRGHLLMGRSKKAYSLLRPNGHTPFFRVRWRDTQWRSTQTLQTNNEGEALRLAARLYEERLVGKKRVTFATYAQDFFIWGKCLWLMKRTEEGAIISKKIASQHRAHLVNYIIPKFGALLLTRDQAHDVRRLAQDFEVVKRYEKPHPQHFQARHGTSSR